MNKSITIEPIHLNIVRSLLKKHLPSNIKVWVFGSRATGNIKNTSDLDLALEDDKAIDNEVLIDLKEAFEYSDLPYKVDLIDMHKISETFKNIVNQQKIKLPF